MDLQSQVAARRAELQRHAVKLKADARAAKTQKNIAESEQRAAALETLAQNLSTENVSIQSDGESLSLVDYEILPLNLDLLKRTEVEALLNREARRRWSPWENWQVIGSIVAGIIMLIPIFPVAAALLGFGFYRRMALNKKYQTNVWQRYPHLSGWREPADNPTEYNNITPQRASSEK